MIKELYSGSAQVFLLRISWAIIGFVGQILIARLLGVESYGQYSLIFAWLAVLCLPGKLGFDESSVKFLSKYYADGRIDRLYAFVKYATHYVLLASVSIAIGSFVVISLAGVVEESVLKTWGIGLLCLPLMCMNSLRQGMLRGMKKFLFSQLPDSTIRPLIVIFAIVILHFGLRWNIELNELMWISFFALLVAFVIGRIWLTRALPSPAQKEDCNLTNDQWLKTSAWMTMLSASILILNRTDILMLGAMQETSEVGLYSAAVRLATLFTFGLAAVNMAIGPLLSSAHTKGDSAGIQKLMQKAALISIGVSLAMLIGMWLFGEYALSLFGKEYLSAQVVFYVLSASHLVSALTGPTSTLMNMSGHHKRVALLFAMAAGFNVLLNYILIPSYGILGAAVATFISASLWKLYSIYFVVVKLQIKPGVLSFTRGSL